MEIIEEMKDGRDAFIKNDLQALQLPVGGVFNDGGSDSRELVLIKRLAKKWSR